MSDRLSPADATTRVLARVTTARALARNLDHALDGQDVHEVKGALEAIAATAIARCFYLEAQNCRLLDGEDSHHHSAGVAPSRRPARAPAPGGASPGHRAIAGFRAAAQEREARARLAPRTGQVADVVPIRPSVLNRSAEQARPPLGA